MTEDCCPRIPITPPAYDVFHTYEGFFDFPFPIDDAIEITSEDEFRNEIDKILSFERNHNDKTIKVSVIPSNSSDGFAVNTNFNKPPEEFGFSNIYSGDLQLEQSNATREDRHKLAKRQKILEEREFCNDEFPNPLDDCGFGDTFQSIQTFIPSFLMGASPESHSINHISETDRVIQQSYKRSNKSISSPLPDRRGLHIRDNPDLQRIAREGAAHWAVQLRAVRAAWAARAAHSPAFLAWFSAQAEAAQGRIKSKQECLLRSLQMAAADGMIAAGPFVEGGGFFGWTRFAVVRDRAGEFRAGIAALFPAGFKKDALKEMFRRAGLVPEEFGWEQAWRGEVAFVFQPKPRRFGATGQADSEA